jgi:hypothetical protein
MTFTRTIAAAAFALAATSAVAGSFVELPSAAPLRKFGAQNLNVDQFYILPGPITGTSEGLNTYAPPTYLELLDSRESEVEIAESAGEGPEEVGTFFDYVFRDTTDSRLVFASRLVLTDDDAEINDIFRGGFTGFSVAAAWTFATDLDLRMFSAARTSTGLLQGVDVFSPSEVNMRSDINVSEGNPQTGWYFLKTDAPFYTLGEEIIRLRQAGEEGQLPTQDIIDGFMPSAVPEPSTYALLLAGIGLVGLIARRRVA